MTEVVLEDLGGAKMHVGVDVGPFSTPNLLKGPPEMVKVVFDNIHNIKFRPDDIMLCTYQKTGTNWLYEILSMINNKSAERVKTNKVMSMIECVPQNKLDELPSPRVLNCHFRPSYLPKAPRGSKIKTVVCFRNPKDTAASFYHHMKGLKTYGYDGKFADWLPIYLQGKLEYGKYTDYLKDWEALITAGAEFPLHVVYFEHLKLNGEQELDKLLKFLEVELDDKLKQDILEACGFEKMAKEKQLLLPKELSDKVFNANFNFYRKGSIGDWKNWFTVAQDELFETIWNAEMKDSTMFEFIYSDPRVVTEQAKLNSK